MEADPMLIGSWRPATVITVYVVDGVLNGYEIQFDAEGNREPERYTVGKTVARGIRPMKESEEAGTAKALPPPTAHDKVHPVETPHVKTVAAEAPAQEQPAQGGVCSSDPGLTATQKAADPMELSFKRAILARFQRQVAEKSLSSPLAVGVSFSSFQVGQPRVNQRTLDRIDGSYMRSAPVGANIYPVKTNFTKCERFTREIIRTVVEGRYECFKDNFGEWACGNASGWRTLETKREILGTQ